MNTAWDWPLSEKERLYRQLDDLIEEMEELRVELPQKCPNCRRRAPVISRTGRELDASARYSAAETTYNICSNCQWIYSYSY